MVTIGGEINRSPQIPLIQQSPQASMTQQLPRMVVAKPIQQPPKLPISHAQSEHYEATCFSRCHVYFIHLYRFGETSQSTSQAYPSDDTSQYENLSGSTTAESNRGSKGADLTQHLLINM